MQVQQTKSKRSYLNATDLDKLYSKREDRALDFDDWLMAKHRKGDIKNDKRGNFLTN